MRFYVGCVVRQTNMIKNDNVKKKIGAEKMMENKF